MTCSRLPKRTIRSSARCASVNAGLKSSGLTQSRPIETDTVMPSSDSATASRIREAVAESELGITVSVSIGRLCVKPDDFKPAFTEAQRALDLMVRFGKREQVINYDRLGVYRLLAQVEDRAGLDAFAGRMLAPLIDYDRARGAPLLKTLEVYLQRHGNLRQSARDLHIHLNTLHYRLRRIGEVTGVDLKDADARLDLLLALRVRALAESK